MAFGCLDGVALLQIRTIAAQPVGTAADLAASRARVNRLGRALMWAGVAFAVIVLGILAVRLSA